MIAAKYETIIRASQHGSHALPVRFNTRGTAVMERSAMNCSPEVSVELEVSAAPIMTHCVKHFFQMGLRFRMRAIDYVPWPSTPATKGDSVRSQRLPRRIFYKPIRMLLENVRLFFSDKWSNPNRGLETTRANLLQHSLYVSTKCSPSFQPVSHRRLVAVVDLNVPELWCVASNEIQIIEHLLCGNTWSKAIPRAPPSWRRFHTQRWMISCEALRYFGQ